MAQDREAECLPGDGNPAEIVCTGSDHTGIAYTPTGALNLRVIGGSDAAETITIIGQGQLVPLPNGQNVEVAGHGISVGDDMNAPANAPVSVSLEGHARIRTNSIGGHGINVRQHGDGPLDILVNGDLITTGGQASHGVNAEHFGTGDISVSVGRGAEITARRGGSNAIHAFQHHDGSVIVRVEEGAILRAAPELGRGIAAFLTNDENSGRIVIENRGQILGGSLSEGILAWARRRSGHVGYVKEDGTTQAPEEIMDDSARTDPLIHIVSSGTIRVGDPGITGLPAQPDPQSLALAINIGILNGRFIPPIPPTGAGIRAYAVDLVDLIDHVAVPKVLSPDYLTALAGPPPPGLTPEQVQDRVQFLAVALGAAGPECIPLAAISDCTLLPVNILSPAEAGILQEVLNDTGVDRLNDVLDALPAEYTDAYKNSVRAFEMTYNSGDILIEVTGGSITSLDGFGIHAGYPIPASKRNGEVRILISEGASVTGRVDGIRLATGGIVDDRRQHFVHVAGEVTGQTGAGVHPVAGGTVIVARTGRVSGQTGILFSGGTGNGAFPITNNVARIDGEIRSTGPELEEKEGQPPVRHAGVRLEGGGTVIVGPYARITAQSGVAILGEPWSGSTTPNAPADVAVVIEPGRRVEERIQGVIRNLNADGSSGAPTRIYIKPGDQALPLTTGSTMPLGVWDVSRQDTATGDISFASEYGDRARIYEALPFVLTDQARTVIYDDRITAPPDRAGPWVRATHGTGDWSASTSTTGMAAYDHDWFRVEGGADIPVGDGFTIGFSGHHHRGSADISGVGGLTLESAGLGLSGTLDRGRFYVDGRIAASRHILNANAGASGGIASDIRGAGYALGVEVGGRAEMGGLLLRPRIGLAHSSVSLDAFTAPAAAGGGEVVLGDADNLWGWLGLLAETGNSKTHRLFASVDIEHQLAGAGKSVTVAGTRLTAQAHPTLVRLGLGGAVRLSDHAPSLQGLLGFSTAGSGNQRLTAEVRMEFSF